VSTTQQHDAERSDAELLDRLRARRPGAFEDLIELYHEPIYRFVYRLLEDPSEAPDITQEVFIKIFLKIGNFRGHSSLKTWIYRIAVNEALNRRRWFFRHRRNEVEKPDSPGDTPSLDWLIDPRGTPFDTLQRRELGELIERSLRHIDDRLRTAVVLRDIEGLSYQEIADTLRVSLGTVKSRILRGREALKSRLLQQAPEIVPEITALPTE